MHVVGADSLGRRRASSRDPGCQEEEHTGPGGEGVGRKNSNPGPGDSYLAGCERMGIKGAEKKGLPVKGL